jgi:hypothetical protein
VLQDDNSDGEEERKDDVEEQKQVDAEEHKEGDIDERKDDDEPQRAPQEVPVEAWRPPVGQRRPARNSARVSIDTLIEATTPLHTLPKYDKECPHCGAWLWPWETANRRQAPCCSGGKVSVPHVPWPNAGPFATFKTLFKKKWFVEGIRRYNVVFVFTSLSMRDPTVLPGHRPLSSTIEGTLHHNIGLLEANPSGPRCAQVYIIGDRGA